MERIQQLVQTRQLSCGEMLIQGCHIPERRKMLCVPCAPAKVTKRNTDATGMETIWTIFASVEHLVPDLMLRFDLHTEKTRSGAASQPKAFIEAAYRVHHPDRVQSSGRAKPWRQACCCVLSSSRLTQG